MALKAIIMGLGLFFDILLGFRAWQGHPKQRQGRDSVVHCPFEGWFWP